MPYGRPRLRTEPANERLDVGDRSDPVMNEIYLSAARELELDRLADVPHTDKLHAVRRDDLLRAMTAVLARVDHRLPPPMAAFEGIVGREPYPVADKAGEILERLSRFGVTRFRALFKGNRSRSEVVATFIAVLELCKARRLRLAGTESDCTVTCTEEGGGELELTTDGEKTAD